MRDVEFVVTMKAATTNMAAIGKAEAGLLHPDAPLQPRQ